MPGDAINKPYIYTIIEQAIASIKSLRAGNAPDPEKKVLIEIDHGRDKEFLVRKKPGKVAINPYVPKEARERGDLIMYDQSPAIKQKRPSLSRELS